MYELEVTQLDIKFQYAVFPVLDQMQQQFLKSIDNKNLKLGWKGDDAERSYASIGEGFAAEENFGGPNSWISESTQRGNKF